MQGKELLGFTLRDKVTGFMGVATGHVEYITGCNQVLLVPKVDADGKLRESNWFDVQRCELLPAEDHVTVDNGVTPGPDKEAPKR